MGRYLDDLATDILVVGAGAVGLAVAREFALSGREVIVVERRSQPGQETSSRNSGVIHSGIYYPTESLKARLCVRGRDLLYSYCERHAVPHRRCGKLVVAQKTHIDALRALHRQALANGVADIRWLSADEVRVMEPAVRCAAALFSPSTGMIDAHQYLLALQGDAEAHGATVATNSELVSVRSSGSELLASIRSRSDTNEPSEIRCRLLINCGGLHAVGLLETIQGYPHARLPKAHFAKGNYFVCRGAAPFKHLVYPMPNEAGLGVHATLSLNGRTRFGPDVEWIDVAQVDGIDYNVDAQRSAGFYGAIREYWPDLPADALQPDVAGVRPKLVGPGQPAADFVIEGPVDHGVAGLINLLGIESPGLTASMAIAEYVAQLATRSA